MAPTTVSLGSLVPLAYCIGSKFHFGPNRLLIVTPRYCYLVQQLERKTLNTGTSKDLDNASIIKLFLSEAVGPPPDNFEDCEQHLEHIISIYTVQKKNKHSTIDLSRLAQYTSYTAQCPAAKGSKCRTKKTAKLPDQRVQALASGINELKQDAPTHPDLTDHAKDMAIERGKVAKEVWEMTVRAGGGARRLARRQALLQATAPKLSVSIVKASRAEKAGNVDLGKGKGRVPATPAVAPINEHDDYSALMYATKDMDTRRITIGVYNTADCPALEYVVWVRFLQHFDISYYRIASTAGIFGRRSVPFQRYSVFEHCFIQETLVPIDVRRRGEFLLYKVAGLAEESCPGIEEWKAKLEKSAIPYLEELSSDDDSNDASDDSDSRDGNDSDDDQDDSDIEIVSYSSHPLPSSSGTASSSSALGLGSSQANKRKRGEFIQGSSKRRKASPPLFVQGSSNSTGKRVPAVKKDNAPEFVEGSSKATTEGFHSKWLDAEIVESDSE
ncbi:hypothetical protein B0H11DRAFT_1910026 [Mycena galericulata]|nr:hypothetical protein B0H11DRAFT_1910026 [Mycena galericulata]